MREKEGKRDPGKEKWFRLPLFLYYNKISCGRLWQAKKWGPVETGYTEEKREPVNERERERDVED